MLNTYNPTPLIFGCRNTNFPFIEETYDSLTTYKMLCKIAGVVNSIQEYLQSLNFNQYKEYVDQQIANLKNYVNQENDKVYVYINDQVENMKNYTDEQISELNLKIMQFINKKIVEIKEYIDNQNIVLKNYVDEEIAKVYKEIENIAIKGIKVYNPTIGKYDFLQNTIDDLYTYLRYYGIKAIEFDTLGLTANNFDIKEITAREFDLYSKEILMINWCCNMYSPISGEIEPISKVVNDLASQQKNEITAQEFDNLDLTAQAFDNKNISAYDFDWNGKSLLVA